MTKGVRSFAGSRVRSFGHAFRGWWHVLRTQRNAWLELGVALAVFAVCAWLGLEAWRWAIVILSTVVVFTAEFFNTAVELVVDLVSPRPHPLAKLAKDVAASAVLVAALGAVVIGLLLIGPPLVERLQGILSR